MSKPSISVTSKSFLFVINSILNVEGIDGIEYNGKRVPCVQLGHRALWRSEELLWLGNADWKQSISYRDLEAIEIVGSLWKLLLQV